MNESKSAGRWVAGLALVALLAGCAHPPGPRARVIDGGYGGGYGQPGDLVEPGYAYGQPGYGQPAPVYTPSRPGSWQGQRAPDDRYPGDRRDGYADRGYGYGYGDRGYGSYPGYGYEAQRGVEYGRVHQIERLSGYRANSGAGALLGGVVGAVIGRQFGSSSNGRAQGTLAGAVGGVLLGNEIERQNRGGRGDGLVISIALDQGGLREFTVPSVGDLRIGDRVRIEGGNRLLRM